MATAARLVFWLAIFVSFGCGKQGTNPPPEHGAIVIDPLANGAAAPISVSPAATNQSPSESDLAIPVMADDAVLGSRLAPVTIVVFSDFQCPYCAKISSTFDEIRSTATYADDVRLVFKHSPLAFHPFARLAAEVAAGVRELAGNEGFWKFHRSVFANQPSLSNEQIIAWAVAAGVSEREITLGLRSHRWTARVDQDVSLAASVGANGTPISFVNGKQIAGAMAKEVFVEAIEEQKLEARAASARGITPENMYRTLLLANLTAANKEALARKEEEAIPKFEDEDTWNVPLGKSPVLGNPQALVTIVVFSDFQCPYCKTSSATLETLRKEYGAKLRVVWKDNILSIHPRARPAATLAREARAQKGDASFWLAHDRIFASQPKLENSDLSTIASGLGLDAKRTMAAIDKDIHASAIEEDAALVTSLRADGTPHFFINGRRLVGAVPYPMFKALVDGELAKAESLVRAGVTRANLYAHITSRGRKDFRPKAPPQP